MKIDCVIVAAYTTVFLTATALANTWSLSNVLLASSSGIQTDLSLTSSVSAGAELAIRECADQFNNEVWNCPVTAFRSRREERENNREAAYIQAITAAGVTHTLTRNCSQGSILHCECEQRRLGNKRDPMAWKWGGCSDNVKFGETVSRQFLDTGESGNDPRSLANLHNSEAGRIAVRKTMKTLCKCHGVSGSCATQTCWRQLGEFREVGKYLKKQYKRALRVDYNDGDLDMLDNLMSNRIDRVPRHQRDRRAMMEKKQKLKRQVKKRKLVFLQSSPDYCRMNTTSGYKGVLGRTCVTDPNNPDSRSQVRKCSKLCQDCGMYVKKKVVDVVTTCNCRFEWCCKVTCETCHKKQIQITCTNTPSFYNNFLELSYLKSKGL